MTHLLQSLIIPLIHMMHLYSYLVGTCHIIELDLVQVLWHSKDFWNHSQDPFCWRWGRV